MNTLDRQQEIIDELNAMADENEEIIAQTAALLDSIKEYTLASRVDVRVQYYS